MGCAALSRWLKEVPEECFRNETQTCVEEKEGEVTAFSPIFWSVRPLDTYAETTSKVSTHSSLHRLRNNGCHCCHHPATKIHSHILQHVNGNCCHLPFPGQHPEAMNPEGTSNLIYMALWFPEYLQSILHLQWIKYWMEPAQLFKKNTRLWKQIRRRHDIKNKMATLMLNQIAPWKHHQQVVSRERFVNTKCHVICTAKYS